jgi:hypothetical protein
MKQTTAVVVTTTSRFERRSQRVSAFLLMLALVTAALVAACSSCSEDAKKPAPTAVAAQDLAPVPEPDGLLAEVFAAKPDQTWKRIRALTGGPVNLLPASFPILVTTLLGLPPTSAGAVDTDVPAVAALVAASPDRVAMVVGLHVQSGRELIAALTTGDAAKFTAKADPSGVTLLEPRAGPSGDFALGIVGNHLLAAPERGLLSRFGPFVARTLPTREMPSDGIVAVVPKQALAGPVPSRLRARWKAYAAELVAADRKNREKHGGRAPDFGDPMVALAGVASGVESLAAAFESSKRARLVLTPLDERLDAKVTLEAEPGGKAAQALQDMPAGDLAPLLASPIGMDAAIFNRTTEPSRQESATSFVEGVAKLFGDRLSEQEKKKLDKVMRDLALGRGDDATYGLLSKDGHTSLIFRGTVKDPKKFADGVNGAVDLLKLKAISEPLKQFVGKLSVKQSTAEIAGIDGRVQRAALTLEPSAMGAAARREVAIGPRSFELLWLVKDGMGFVTLSAESSSSLVDLVTASGAGTLAGDPATKAAAERTGAGTSFSVLVQPLRLGLGGPGKNSAPLLMALGKDGAVGWLRVEADKAAVKAIVQRFVKL